MKLILIKHDFTGTWIEDRDNMTYYFYNKPYWYKWLIPEMKNKTKQKAFPGMQKILNRFIETNEEG